VTEFQVDTTWSPLEGDADSIVARYPQPLLTLAQGDVPAFILRRAFNPDHCSSLVRRFYERGLLYDPRRPDGSSTPRVDIGTSLGHLSASREKFFAHASATHALYETLFESYDDPVKTIYDTLSRLAPGKRVMVAREPDGQLYGPAIFRTYYPGAGHGPHFDSVSKRSKLFDYAVSRFKHQFAGVLCFQNAEDDGETAQSLLYRCQWTPDLQPVLTEGRFHAHAAERNIARVRIEIQPGDLYFFFSETVHEVPPAVKGDVPRIVLAVFFGMSPEDEEIYVWS
jgi:hypothetical protein